MTCKHNAFYIYKHQVNAVSIYRWVFICLLDQTHSSFFFDCGSLRLFRCNEMHLWSVIVVVRRQQVNRARARRSDMTRHYFFGGGGSIQEILYSHYMLCGYKWGQDEFKIRQIGYDPIYVIQIGICCCFYTMFLCAFDGLR